MILEKIEMLDGRQVVRACLKVQRVRDHACTEAAVVLMSSASTAVMGLSLRDRGTELAPMR